MLVICRVDDITTRRARLATTPLSWFGHRHFPPPGNNRARTIIMEPIPPSRIGNVRGSGIPPSRPRCMTTWPRQQKRGLFHGASRGAQVVEVTLLTAMTWAAEPVFHSQLLRAVDRPFWLRPQTHGAVRQ